MEVNISVHSGIHGVQHVNLRYSDHVRSYAKKEDGTITLTNEYPEG